MADEQAPRDQNQVPSLLLMDDVTGDTIPAVCDSEGNLLVVASLTDVTVPDGGTGVTSFTPYAVITGGTTSTGALQQVSGLGTAGQVLTSNGAGALPSWQSTGGGSGTVTSVSVTTANGVSGSVANATTTPAITLTLGAITPTTVNGLTISTTTGTLTIANGKTLTANKTMSFTAADDTGTYTFPTGTKTLVATDVTALSSLATVGTITSGTWNGTDIALADGGTGASLSDPNADRIMFWDDSAGSVAWLTAGSGLTITDTTISASGASDNKASSLLWDIEENRRVSTRASGTGFVDASSSYLYLLDTGSTSGSVAGRYGSSSDVINDLQGFLPASTGWQNDFYMELSAKCYTAANHESWFGFCIQSSASTFEPTSGAVVTRHACFFFNGSQIIASNANGTTQTSTNVSGDPTIMHAYRIEFDYNATSVKFYLDDTLVATHTTNLPTTTNAIAPVFGVKNSTAAERALVISRMFEVGTLI